MNECQNRGLFIPFLYLRPRWDDSARIS